MGSWLSFSKNATTYGLITLMTMSFAAGLVMYLMFRLIYKPQSEGQKKTTLKTFATLTLAFLGWITRLYFNHVNPKRIQYFT
jgi:uncharacterized membrane-anchored protein